MSHDQHSRSPEDIQTRVDQNEPLGSAATPDALTEFALREAVGDELADAFADRPTLSFWSRHRSLLGAAAAIAVVGFVAFLDQRSPDPSEADNQDQELVVEDETLRVTAQLSSDRITHPFEVLPLRVRLESKAGETFSILPPSLSALDPHQAARAFVAHGPEGTTPIRLSFTITDVDGREFRSPSGQTLEGVDGAELQRAIQAAGIEREFAWPPTIEANGPLNWSSRTNPAGYRDSLDRLFRMPRARSPEEGAAATEFFRPSDNGTVHTTLHIERLPISPGAGWTERPALALSFDIEVEALFGDWSETVDGMRARVIPPPSATKDGEFPVAIVLENVSSKTMQYNFVGVSSVDIPQPQHFDLVIDGEQLQQRDRLPILITGDLCFTPHKPRTRRTLGAVLRDWHLPEDLPKREAIELGAVFEFRPLLVGGTGPKTWAGRIEIPAVRVPIEKK
ncbi:MAG: hypothetical protein AAF196_10410 [Planctomycetota bacterium]